MSERARLTRCFKPEDGTPTSGWHTVFAWRPKMTEDRGVSWLRQTYARKIEHEGETVMQYAWKDAA